MRQILLGIISFCVFMTLSVVIYSACMPSRTYVTLVDTWCKADLTIEKRERNYVRWPDGTMSNSIDTKGFGGCDSSLNPCYPDFTTPIESEGHWEQLVADRIVLPTGPCAYPNPQINRFYEANHSCAVAGGGDDGWGGECDLAICVPDPNPYLDQTLDRGCCYNTPLLIDVASDGFSLSDASHGVSFDLRPDGTPERLAWTTAGSDDAWLALDRNGNGIVDDGRELFGNFTPQAKTNHPPNGFIALAEFDKATQAGNMDGVIDNRDAIYSSLRLWQDSNHNGISEAAELHSLSELGIASLELDYKESKRTDDYGNQFRYRAKVKNAHGAQVGRWAWDVFLVKQ